MAPSDTDFSNKSDMKKLLMTVSECSLHQLCSVIFKLVHLLVLHQHLCSLSPIITIILKNPLTVSSLHRFCDNQHLFCLIFSLLLSVISSFHFPPSEVFNHHSVPLISSFISLKVLCYSFIFSPKPSPSSGCS